MSNDRSNGSATSSSSEDSLAKEMTESLLERKKEGKEEEEEEESERKRDEETGGDGADDDGKVKRATFPFGARRLVKRRKVVNDGAELLCAETGMRRRTTRKRTPRRSANTRRLCLGFACTAGKERRR